MAPQAQEKLDRRSEILAAAARRFVRQGFVSSSLREIAADCGIQPAAIYYYFPSKTDILTAVHEEGMRQIEYAVLASLALETEPWQRLEAACIAHLNAVLDGGIFFQALMQERPGEKEAARHIIALRDKYEDIFKQLISALNMPAKEDQADLRLMLLGAMNWAHYWYRPDNKSPEVIARQFIKFLRTRLD